MDGKSCHSLARVQLSGKGRQQEIAASDAGHWAMHHGASEIYRWKKSNWTTVTINMIWYTIYYKFIQCSIYYICNILDSNVVHGTISLIPTQEDIRIQSRYKDALQHVAQQTKRLGVDQLSVLSAFRGWKETGELTDGNRSSAQSSGWFEGEVFQDESVNVLVKYCWHFAFDKVWRFDTEYVWMFDTFWFILIL